MRGLILRIERQSLPRVAPSVVPMAELVVQPAELGLDHRGAGIGHFADGQLFEGSVVAAKHAGREPVPPLVGISSRLQNQRAMELSLAAGWVPLTPQMNVAEDRVGIRIAVIQGNGPFSGA